MTLIIFKGTSGRPWRATADIKEREILPLYAMSGRYWLGTIPYASFVPIAPLPESVSYLRGQQEIGLTTSYHHWQLLAVFTKTVRLSFVIATYPGGNWELSRSKAADDYVWKEDTAVPDTKFELGSRLKKRNSKADWDQIRSDAISGELDAIPADVYVRCFHQLRSISSHFAVPAPRHRECFVFWGPTRTGKSRRAWEEAGMDAYPKNARTKWWDGYRNQQNVVIDEFRGAVDIGYLLVWLDRYPNNLEIKGGQVPNNVDKFWITSNISPRLWFPEADQSTTAALLARLKITEFLEPLI